MAAELFFAFTTSWTIADDWSAAASFVLCAAPCVIIVTWYAAGVFSFYFMILYQFRLKHVS